MCPPGTYSKSQVRAYREATTKLFRGTTTTFDQSMGAIACTNCAAGTYQPKSGGKNADECLKCPQGTYSNSGAAKCLECPAGTYQPYEGMAGPTSCLPCQSGKCSDAPGSTDCYQCCPISNLACPKYLKRAKGFYGVKEWYSNNGETGRVPVDEYSAFLEDLCARGCETYKVTNWCVTGECPSAEELAARAAAAAAAAAPAPASGGGADSAASAAAATPPPPAPSGTM